MGSCGGGREERDEALHAVMFPWFAFGHISPFVQMANKLAAHGLRVSFLSAPANIPRIASSVKGATQVVPVHIPAVAGLPPEVQSTAEMTPAMAELLKLATDQMGPQVEAILARLRPQFIFFDFGMQWLPPIAARLGVKSLFFSIFSSITGAHIMVPARLVDGKSPTVDDMKKPPPGLRTPALEGLTTKEADDFLYVFKSFGGPSVYDRVTACRRSCDAIIEKSCLEMESTYIKYIEEQYRKPILLAGSLVPEPPAGELDSRWANWLSQFPEKSVIFCSFGSETFLSEEQIKELAWGLEQTGAPFLLVLNFPASGEQQLREALPAGFSDKVAGRGVVHSGWVQQQLVLAHPSVGCYVSHGGWSSIVEGVVNDLRLVLLPLRGDQFLNARLVSKDLKAGVLVNRRDEDGAFSSGDLCDAVKAAQMAPAWGGELKEFLCDKEKQEGFARDLVEKMKQMVEKDLNFPRAGITVASSGR